MAYCTVQDLRDEGVASADASDARLTAVIPRVCALIDRLTGRWFEPRTQVLRLNGNGGRALLLGPPIVSITSVKVVSGLDVTADIDIDSTYYRVYNRHLTEGLLDPDDRNNPKIEFFDPDDGSGTYYRGGTGARLGGLVFPRGQQNIEVSGKFGYTDPTTNPPPANDLGITPLLIKHAAKLLVLREMHKLYSERDRREDALTRGRLLSERTRDQSYTLGADRRTANLTGDPEVDEILETYRRPMRLGAV